ncbi:hypothetical protein SELMODRAFT_34765, partial [Selaginella moellendorffii]
IHSLVHRHGLAGDRLIGNYLVKMFVRCGDIDRAREVFDRVSARDVILWTEMIAAYGERGYFQESLELWKIMRLEGAMPDLIAFVTALKSCCCPASLGDGALIHWMILESGLGSNVIIQNSLLAMYARCGRLELAQLLFDGMPERSVFSWNSMVAAYAQHGHLDQVFQSLKRMQNEGVKPDSVTFVSVLSACSGAGLLVEGRSHFEFVKRHIREWPSTEHYGCMIDLLGRLGRLEEAERLVLEVPDKAADAVLWRTLLAASRTYGDLERGRRAAERVVDLDPDDSAAYVVLYNTVA